jgi:hypothetical protein
MTLPDVPEDDLVEGLLSMDWPAGADSARARLLAQTTSIVGRRRIVRRAWLAAALAGCYLAGLLTTWGAIAEGRKAGPTWPNAAVVQEQAAGDEAPEKAAPAAPKRTPSPKAKRLGPVSGPRHRGAAVARADFEQIRRVSDRFLRERGDIATALHYYSRALKHASGEERAISVETDSWLLMALKQAHIEEERENDPNA